MIPSSYLILCLLIVCTACNGQQTRIERTYSTFTQTTIVQGDTVSKLSNSIMIVFQDSKNVYWFGSYIDGVYKYDGKSFINFNKKHGLSANRVDEIKEDDKGNLYFNTTNGVDKFDGFSITKVPIANNTSSEWKLANGDIWFKSNSRSQHVYRFDGEVLHPLNFPATKIGNEFISDVIRLKKPNLTINDPYSLYCIYTDSMGNIWFGSSVLGVCRYNGKTIDWIHESDLTEIHDGPSNGIRSILEDKDGYFWFNSMFKYKINDSTDSNHTNWYVREKNIGSLDEKKEGEITEYLSSVIDNNNTIWIVTWNAGIWEYNGKEIKNHLIKKDGNVITLFSIYKDNLGSLWVGTHENGAYKYTGNAFVRFTP